ncbi:MAG: hypothetical protein WAM70_21310, partial [Pyrinomonadaceae bacterium]
QAVRRSAEGSWAWYGRFARIDAPNAARNAGFSAVHVHSYLEQDTVRVVISLLSGEKGPENKKQIAEYVIRETEKITVEELRQFGIQPFEIKLVRLAPTLGPVPRVVLKDIQSLLVVKSVANDSTLPSFKISFLNQSGKDVMALGVNVTASANREMTSLPRGVEGHPLIEAGTVQELQIAVPLRSREAIGGYEPFTIANQRIEITTVVFADGTFEGDPSGAANFKSIRASEKAELSRLIPLLESAMGSTEDISDALKKLERNVRFPGNNAATNPNASNGPTTAPREPGRNQADETFFPPIRAELMKEIRILQSEDRLDRNRYMRWLGFTKKRFERWLARL